MYLFPPLAGRYTNYDLRQVGGSYQGKFRAPLLDPGRSQHCQPERGPRGWLHPSHGNLQGLHQLHTALRRVPTASQFSHRDGGGARSVHTRERLDRPEDGRGAPSGATWNENTGPWVCIIVRACLHVSSVFLVVDTCELCYFTRVFPSTHDLLSSDYVYNGYYINSVDSGNYNTAKGFNYHQGPVRTPAIVTPTACRVY